MEKKEEKEDEKKEKEEEEEEKKEKEENERRIRGWGDTMCIVWNLLSILICLSFLFSSARCLNALSVSEHSLRNETSLSVSYCILIALLCKTITSYSEHMFCNIKFESKLILGRQLSLIRPRGARLQQNDTYM